MTDKGKKGKIPIKALLLLVLAAFAIHAAFFFLFDYGGDAVSPGIEDRDVVYLLDFIQNDENESLSLFINLYDPAAVFAVGSGIGFDSLWQAPRWEIPPGRSLERLAALLPERATQVEVGLMPIKELSIANSWLPEVAVEAQESAGESVTPEAVNYPKFFINGREWEVKLPEGMATLPDSPLPATEVVFRREAGFWRYRIEKSSGNTELDSLLILLVRRDKLATTDAKEFFVRANWREAKNAGMEMKP